MDLLFSKYADPFLFMEQMLSLDRLSEFVSDILNIDNERKLWELYLATVSNPIAEVGSFEDFKNKVTRTTAEPVSEKKLEATVKESKNILQDFNPTERREVD